MWHSENDSCGGQVVALIEHRIKGHAPGFVTHCDPSITIDGDPDVLAKACYGFIYGVIERLPQEVQQARGGR